MSRIGRETWEKRIFSKVKKSSSGCWLWQGLKNQGYGFAKWDSKFILLHRFSYLKTHKKLPKGKVLNHKCRRRHCINPAHLEPITNRQNILIGNGPAAKNARKKRCKYGHHLTKENTYSEPGKNFRRCRKCGIRRTSEWRRNVT